VGTGYVGGECNPHCDSHRSTAPILLFVPAVINSSEIANIIQGRQSQRQQLACRFAGQHDGLVYGVDGLGMYMISPFTVWSTHYGPNSFLGSGVTSSHHSPGQV
jgi:hypothetical protein